MTKEKWKGIKAEFKPGGSKRQELLNKAVQYLREPGPVSYTHLTLPTKLEV